MIYDKKSFLTDNIDDPTVHQKIIDALPVPIFYRDTKGVYQMCNEAHVNFTGKKKEAIVGKSLHEVHVEETADKFWSQDQLLMLNPDVQIYNTRMRHNDGSSRHVVLNKAVIRDDKGEIVGIVGSINDISDLKRTEEKLQKAQEATEVSSQMIHKISAGIVMVNDAFKIVDSNESFARLMGEDIDDLYETIPGLTGADAKSIIPDVILKMIASVLTSGEEVQNRDLTLNDKLMHISVLTLYKNRVVGVVFRDMSAPRLVQDEIINRARKINRQNIETVQKIAYLLGENAAETEELLNSIIETYRYGDDDKA